MTRQPVAEAVSFVPVVGDRVRDLRDGFGGRTGTVTCLFPFTGPVAMVFVRPDDWDGEGRAEWNADPGDVGPVGADVPPPVAGGSV